MEKERLDLSSIHKKLEMVEIENEIEMKKQEMAMKRAEDLADTFLKAKNLKVRFYGTNFSRIYLQLNIFDDFF